MAQLETAAARFLPASLDPGQGSVGLLEEVVGALAELTSAVDAMRAELAEMRRTRSIAS